MQETESLPTRHVTAQSVKALKRRYATLKGWIKRKHIRILDYPEPGALFVEYEGQYMRTKAWYTSPNGREDADTVRQYLEAKIQLKKLGEF